MVIPYTNCTRTFSIRASREQPAPHSEGLARHTQEPLLETNTPLFPKYEAAVRVYGGDPCSPNLLLAQEGPLSVYYAPVEWVNRQAKVILVGITPGKTQAGNALAEAQRRLSAGAATHEVLRQAKQTGAFSGTMRPNLVALMDCVGLPRVLGLRSCEDLFGSASHLLQSASVLPFPVFLNGDNYNGAPDLIRTPFLRKLMLAHFLPMVRELPDAALIPLGPVPTKALSWLVQQGYLPGRRVLEGLPHPSGANGERIAYFLGRKSRSELSLKTDASKLDAARAQLLSAVAALCRPSRREPTDDDHAHAILFPSKQSVPRDIA